MTTYKNIHGKKIKFLASDPPAEVAEGQVWYNGTDFKTSIASLGWSSGGNMGTARYNLSGCGTQTAALGFGGYIAGSGGVTLSEEYNGTSYSE